MLGKLRAVGRLGVFGAITAVTGVRLMRVRGLGHSARITHEWGRWCARAVGLRVERTGALAAASLGPALIVANHRSYADVPALAACLPCHFLAKAEVASWPVVGFAAQRSGTVFTTRDDPQSGAAALRELRSRLAHGVSMVIFPEGTTIGGPGIGPFQRGVFGLAAAAGVPVIPVAIEYADAEDAWVEPGDASFVPHFLRCFARRAVPVRVAFGPALVMRDGDELRVATERWIRANLRAPAAAAPTAATARKEPAGAVLVPV